MSPWSFRSMRLLEGEPSVRLRGVDVIIIVACSLAALTLVGPGRWVPGALKSATLYALLVAGLLMLRMLEAAWPRQRVLAFVADFWLLPVITLGHGFLNPLVDSINPVLRDAQIATLEQRLFGVQVSVALSNAMPPWLNDVLLVCYYGHFVWPLVLGLVLYFGQRSAAFDEYLLGLGLFFGLNYLAYALVPVIGPRFFLFNAFPAPLAGPLITPLLESVMRTPAFMRDCFPSGHTGATLLVFFYSFRFARRLFWVVLPPGVGLIVATVAGRFHYATDLLAAVPLVVVVAGLALGLSRAAGRRQVYAAERSVPVDAIVRP